MVQKRAFISAVAAVAVHALVFGIWILFIIWDLPLMALDKRSEASRPEPEMTVLMIPYLPKPKPDDLAKLEPPEPKPLPQVAETPEREPPEPTEPGELAELEEPKQRFARTSADQEAQPDGPTDILGERDTRAASELAPTPGADPNAPSQDGDDPLYKGHVETVTKEYEDGSVGKDQIGEETETPQEASMPVDSTLTDDSPELDEALAEQEASGLAKNKHLKEGVELPSVKTGKTDAQIEQEPKTKPSPRERSELEPQKDGFSGYSKQTRMTGSISRRGKSAINVRNSPLGRYQALVSKAVELQWRRNCEQHRDHIVPGVISLRFYVDDEGAVSGIQFQEVIGANYIERGFTQRAIRQAKLPQMSEEVVEELNGELLELVYNFYF